MQILSPFTSELCVMSLCRVLIKFFSQFFDSYETASVASVTPNNNKLISNKRSPETDEDDSTQSKKQKKNGTFEHTTKLEDNQGQRKKAYQWSLEQAAAVDVHRNGKSICHHLSFIFWLLLRVLQFLLRFLHFQNIIHCRVSASRTLPAKSYSLRISLLVTVPTPAKVQEIPRANNLVDKTKSVITQIVVQEVAARIGRGE